MDECHQVNEEMSHAVFCIIMAITYETVQKVLYRQKLVNCRPMFIH